MAGQSFNAEMENLRLAAGATVNGGGVPDVANAMGVDHVIRIMGAILAGHLETAHWARRLRAAMFDQEDGKALDAAIATTGSFA